MEKFKRTLKNDIWIILLDIIAVNAAYFLALLVRFFDNTTYGTEGAT